MKWVAVFNRIPRGGCEGRGQVTVNSSTLIDPTVHPSLQTLASPKKKKSEYTLNSDDDPKVSNDANLFQTEFEVFTNAEDMSHIWIRCRWCIRSKRLLHGITKCRRRLMNGYVIFSLVEKLSSSSLKPLCGSQSSTLGHLCFYTWQSAKKQWLC